MNVVKIVETVTATLCNPIYLFLPYILRLIKLAQMNSKIMAILFYINHFWGFVFKFYNYRSNLSFMKCLYIVQKD